MQNKNHFMKRLGSLGKERESWITRAKEISEYQAPYSGRFSVEDRNKGDARDGSIYDNAATVARRIHAAGMQSGSSSPTQNWFELETNDRDLMKFTPASLWLDHSVKVMRQILNQSNFYQVNHGLYDENATFGTACSLLFRDFKDVIRLYPKTFGEYFVAHNNRSVVDTIYSEFQMTADQLVDEFGIENVSETVRNMVASNNQRDGWVTVIHAIEPNKERDVTRSDNRNMPWHSVYFEKGGNEEKFLRRGGFRDFPGLVPRWDVKGRDVYGSECPGMVALGDTKQLQDDHYRKAKVLDYKTDPPLQIPAELRREADTIPGAHNYYTQTQPHGGIRTAFEVALPMNELLEDIHDIRQRLNRAYFVDVFQMMIQDQRRQPATAREVDEKHLEKMLMLGPTVERNQNDHLGPAIDNLFAFCLEGGLFRPVPKEMEGQELSVKYVGVLAQAQRAVGLSSVDRFIGLISGVASINQTAVEKMNTDNLIDEYANRLGISQDLLVGNKEVALIRADRAKAQQAAQQAQQAASAAQTAKVMSETDTQSSNALTETVKQLAQVQ